MAYNVEEMMSAYKNGRTLKDVGSMFGISPSRVSEILKENNVKIRKGGFQKKAVAKQTFIEKVRKSIVTSEEYEERFKSFESLYAGFELFIEKYLKDDVGNKKGISVAELFRVYVGVQLEGNLSVVPFNQFIWLLSIYYDAESSEPSEATLAVSNNAILKFNHVGYSVSDNVVKYYLGLTSKNVFRKLINREESWSQFEKDATMFCINDELAKDFLNKYKTKGALYDRGRFVAGECVEEPAECVEEPAAECVVEENAGPAVECVVEETTEAAAIRTFKQFRRMFTYAEFIPKIVSAELCSDRHDIRNVENVELTAPAIFKTLTHDQLFDFDWMERRAAKWIEDNIIFCDGKAQQELCVYTTGYNPLNATLIKTCYAMNVNLYFMYYIYVL